MAMMVFGVGQQKIGQTWIWGVLSIVYQAEFCLSDEKK